MLKPLENEYFKPRMLLLQNWIIWRMMEAMQERSKFMEIFKVTLNTVFKSANVHPFPLPEELFHQGFKFSKIDYTLNLKMTTKI